MTKQASPLRSGSIIGILGTGQLGRMLSLAGAQLGFKTHIYGPEENAPASEVSWRTTTADYRDETALTHFAESVDVLTYEFENVPQETANFLSQFVPVRPPVRALDVAQDRLTEKTSLQSADFQWPAFRTSKLMKTFKKYMRGLTVKALLKPVDLDMMAKASGE